MGCVDRSKLAKGKAAGTLFSPESQLWWAGSFYISKLSYTQELGRWLQLLKEEGVCLMLKLFLGTTQESLNWCMPCVWKGLFLLLNWTELQRLESFCISRKSECNLGLLTCVKATMWKLLFQVVKVGMSISSTPAIATPCLVWTFSHKKNIICVPFPSLWLSLCTNWVGSITWTSACRHFHLTPFTLGREEQFGLIASLC